MVRSLRAARIGAALMLVAMVAACSFTRFGYNQADTIVSWMVNDYFDLDAQQKQDFQKRFDRLYTWHRQEQLPEYAVFMKTARSRVQQGLTREDVLWFVDNLRSRVRMMARKAGPDAAALLVTLTPAQVENLQRKWDKDNAKYVKEHKVKGTPDERNEAEARRVIKHFKEWLTPLNSDQEQRVIALVRELPQIEQFRYAERVRRQKEFMDVLAQRGQDRERFTARVTEWLANWDKGRGADDQKRLDAWWAKRADVFVAMERMMTPDQRTVALQRMQTYIEDFTQLARRTDGGYTAAR
jgi:uncharacterized protein DUF6279